MISRMSRNALIVTAAVAGTAVLASAAAAPGGREIFKPAQGLSFTFGSKRLAGYYGRENQACRLTVLITEKTDPLAAPPPSPVRFTTVLPAGATARLDSVENAGMELQCGPGAETLEVRRTPLTQ